MAGKTINGDYACSYLAISTGVTTVVKASPGFLHTIVVTGGTAGTIDVYDNTAGSGTKIASFSSTNAVMNYEFRCQFTTGLTIVTSAATQLTVNYI